MVNTIPKATRRETYDKDISKRRKSAKQPLSLYVAKVCGRYANERDLPMVERTYVHDFVCFLAAFGSDFWSSCLLLFSSSSSRSLNISASATASWVVVLAGRWLLW